MKYVILNVGCLECEVWTYVYATAETEEEGRAKLRELCGEKTIQDFTPTGDPEFDAKATCVAYHRIYKEGEGMRRIAELHRVPGG